MFTPTPTQGINAMTSTASLTARAMSLAKEAAFSPTAEPTVTTFPAMTDTQIPIVLPVETLIPSPTTASGITPVTGASCIPDNPPQTGRVLDIVDGDTIVVVLDQDGDAYSVRYIGVDAPENTGRVEPFGIEAAVKNRELAHGKNVTLIKDVSETDRLGHLLRYVLADGVFVNYELVAQGYAKAASYYSPDVACIPAFQAAEEQAASWRLGLWGNPPPPTPMPTGVSLSGVPPVCSCSGNLYNCSDFSTHASAQACYDYCVSTGHGDIHRLDSGQDGSACEDLP